jgi:DNA-binding CsgD family transcriptional regulator
MISTEQLSSLLAKLYATPLNHAMWQAFIDELCGITEVSSGYFIDTAETKSPVIAGGGPNYDPSVFQLYNKHGTDDPYKEPTIVQTRPRLIPGEELVSHSDLVKTELYNEVLRRFDLEHMNMLCCASRDQHVEVLSLWRDSKRGPLDNKYSKLFDMLIPHLQLTLGLRGQLRCLESTTTFSVLSIEALSIASLLVTYDGTVLHINNPGKKLVNTGTLFGIAQGKLRMRTLNQSSQLQSILVSATQATNPKGGAMEFNDGNRPIVMTAIPIPEDNRIATNDRCALVMLRDLSAIDQGKAQILRSLFRLSPSECRLAGLLLEGHELNECAGMLRITVGTARFQLKKIFEKTGTKRQSALLRLMLSMPPIAIPSD